jgi:hypothetical protein
LSLSLTAATFFPDLSTSTLEIGFAVGVGIGLPGGAALLLANRMNARRRIAATAFGLGGLDPDEVKDLDEDAHEALTRAERKALREQDRMSWRTPALDTLTRPPFSPLRKAGMLTLRAYLVIAVLLVIVKVTQLALGG